MAETWMGRCYEWYTYLFIGSALTVSSYYGARTTNWDTPYSAHLVTLVGLPVGVGTIAYGFYKLAVGKKCRRSSKKKRR